MNDFDHGSKDMQIAPPILSLGAALSAALRDCKSVEFTEPKLSSMTGFNAAIAENGRALEKLWDQANPPLSISEYVTKDSGARQQFASGMQRDVDTGKLKPHLCMSGPMFKRWAGLMTRGAVKYDDDNWMKAEGQAEYDRFRASAFRHFFQWWNGETDEDHAAAVFFNINGAEYTKERL